MPLPADPPPMRPIEPAAAECCGEGCARCVFDIYEEALERYAIERAAWKARQQATIVQRIDPGPADPGG